VLWAGTKPKLRARTLLAMTRVVAEYATEWPRSCGEWDFRCMDCNEKGINGRIRPDMANAVAVGATEWLVRLEKGGFRCSAYNENDD